MITELKLTFRSFVVCSFFDFSFVRSFVWSCLFSIPEPSFEAYRLRHKTKRQTVYDITKSPSSCPSKLIEFILIKRFMHIILSQFYQLNLNHYYCVMIFVNSVHFCICNKILLLYFIKLINGNSVLNPLCV